MVKELLEFFVGEIDAKLFKGIEFEDFETSNIEDTNEERSRKVSGEGTVDDFDEPFEESIENSLADGLESVVDLLDGLTLGDVVGTDLDSWGAKSLGVFRSRDTEHVASKISMLVSFWLGLFFSRLLLEDHVSGVHKTSCNHVDTGLLLSVETKNIEGFVSSVELLDIIDRFDLDLSH